MKELTIEDWQRYGDYMLFANLVDQTEEWIILKTSGNVITAMGKEAGITKLSELLTKYNITFKI